MKIQYQSIKKSQINNMSETNITKSKYILQLTEDENERNIHINRIKYIFKKELELTLKKLLYIQCYHHREALSKGIENYKQLNIFEILDIADDTILERRLHEREKTTTSEEI